MEAEIEKTMTSLANAQEKITTILEGIDKVSDFQNYVHKVAEISQLRTDFRNLKNQNSQLGIQNTKLTIENKKLQSTISTLLQILITPSSSNLKGNKETADYISERRLDLDDLIAQLTPKV